MSIADLGWIAVLVVVAGSLVTSVLPSLQPVTRAAPAVIVVATSLLLTAFDLRVTPSSAVFETLGAIGITAVGVVSGSAVTNAVLRLAMRAGTPAGTHGGILVTASGTDAGPGRDGLTRPTTSATKEVLRGGTAIGHLERFAVIGAAAIGHLEIIAAVIAIKGLGRFSELDSAEARERFIVGTLASLLWAGTAAFAASLV